MEVFKTIIQTVRQFLIHRKTVIIGFIFILLLFFHAGLYFLIHGLKMDLNNDMNALLNEYGILVDISTVRTSFIPYPHLYIDKYYMNVDNDTFLTFRKIKIDVDLWQLVFNQKLMVRNIYVGHTNIRVKGKSHDKIIRESREALKKGFFMEKAKVDFILQRIQHYIRMIPHQFDYTESLFAAQVDIVLEGVDTESPFIVARQVTLKNKDPHLLTVSVVGTLQQWLHVNLDLEIWKNPDDPDNWIQKIHVFQKGHLELDHLNAGIPGLVYQYTGNIRYFHSMSFGFPLKEIKHYGNVFVDNLEIREAYETLIRIQPSDSARVNFGGNADASGLSLKNITIYLNHEPILADMEWNYAAFRMTFLFQNAAIPYYRVNRLAPSTKIPGLRLYSPSNLVLGKVVIHPWSEDIYAQFYLDLNVQPISLSMPARLTGSFYMINSVLFSRLVTISGLDTKVNITGFRYSGDIIQFHASGSLSSLWLFEHSRGFLYLYGDIHCSGLNHLVRCEDRMIRVAGEGIRVPSGTASRFFRLVSVDIFSSWKSLKPSSEIEIHSLDIQGRLSGDRFIVQNSLIDSDVGYFRIEGYFPLSGDDARMKARFQPLNMDKIVMKIPLIGSPMEKALSYTSEIIIYMRRTNKEWIVEKFFLGKGMEKLGNKNSKDGR